MVSWVASVEVQFKVEGSPCSTVAGEAESVTVGCDGAGGGASCVGVGATAGFLLQPNVKTAAATAKNRPARTIDRDSSIILLLLQNGFPVLDPRSRHRSTAGQIPEISQQALFISRAQTLYCKNSTRRPVR